jgi:hypothetical protein
MALTPDDTAGANAAEANRAAMKANFLLMGFHVLVIGRPVGWADLS